MFSPVTLALVGTSLSANLSDSSAHTLTTSADGKINPLVANISSTATTTSSSILYHKQFEFEYGSTTNDELEVDVDIQGSDSESDNYDGDSDDPDAIVEKRGTPSNFNALLHSVQGDDVVWVTRYTDGTTTIPVPSTTQTQTVTGTTTVATTDTTTATTTLVAPTTVTTVSTDLVTTIATLLSTVQDWQTKTVTATELGPTSNFSQAIQTDDPAVDCSAQNQQAFQLGYVNGAEWGYTIGYNDGSRGRPFIVPSFLTGAQTPYTVAPQTLPPPQVPTPQPSPPPPPPPAQYSYPALSYTTVSYWVPYGGYEPGYNPGYNPYRQPYAGENPVVLEESSAPQSGESYKADTKEYSGVRLNVFDTVSPETTAN